MPAFKNNAIQIKSTEGSQIHTNQGMNAIYIENQRITVQLPKIFESGHREEKVAWLSDVIGATGGLNWIYVEENMEVQNGYGYGVDTSVTRTLTLPEIPELGFLFGVADVTDNANNHPIIVVNSGQKINGKLNNFLVVETGSAYSFVFVSEIVGWRMIAEVSTDKTVDAGELG